MRRYFILVFVLLVGVTGVLVAEEYDRDHVVEVMRNNVKLMGEISEAAEEEDWFLAAFKLFKLAERMFGILPYEPPRGEVENWEETITEFIYAAFIGIGAIGAQDSETFQSSIDMLWQFNRQGHREHKPR